MSDWQSSSNAENRQLTEKLEQLMDLSEELQTENEQLRIRQKKQAIQIRAQEETIESQRQQIQKLLSDNQKLYSVNQKLESRVAQQAELIERQNGSDLELKKAEEMRKDLQEKEKKWQKELKDAQWEVTLANRKMNAAVSSAQKAQEQAADQKSKYDKLISSEKSKIIKEAEQLNKKFSRKWLFIGKIVLTYSILVTVLTGVFSERVRHDCFNAAKLIYIVVDGIFRVMEGGATAAASIGNKITQPAMSKIVYGIIFIVVFFAMLGIIGAVVYFIGKAVIIAYKEYCYDEISLLVLMISVVTLVWCAELMPLNIILLLILSHVAYFLVRWYINGYKENH